MSIDTDFAICVRWWRGAFVESAPAARDSSKWLRYTLELFERVPVERCLLRFVPFCTSSEPGFAKLPRTDWRCILVPKLDATTRTVFVEGSTAIEPPRRIIEM